MYIYILTVVEQLPRLKFLKTISVLVKALSHKSVMLILNVSIVP